MAQLIVALDFPDASSALKMAEILKGHVSWVKIGLQLFISAGPQLVKKFKQLGFNIFLDLKFYDIPNTVASATLAAAALGVNMLTLHCQGGEKMCRSARAALDTLSYEERPLLMGVTVLTSLGLGELPGISMTPMEYGCLLANKAHGWGLDGVICSGYEVAAIKADCPGMICVCPGIRLPDSVIGDQQRVMTPQAAAGAGADYLVVGRPVTAAPDPLKMTKEILQQINS